MPASNQIRLLVLDDDVGDFRILARHLETVRTPRYGFTHASNIEEARVAISDNTFDAALIDYRLSESQNGLDFVKELGGREAPFPIVLLTGMGDGELDREAILSGTYDFIDKMALTRELADRAIRFSISSYRYERELRATIAEAKEQAAINQRTLALVSHEMKSPISSIIGYCDYIIDNCNTETTRDAAGKMKAASTHLQDFLSNLSEFVRLDSKAVQISRSSFQLKTMLDETVDFFEPYAQHKGISLIKIFDPMTDGVFVGDRLRVRQVMINLLKNAISYSDGGTIAVTAEWRNDILQVRI
ncbi:MAG: response regulator, partial [Pseudomonadota bacterium]